MCAWHVVAIDRAEQSLILMRMAAAAAAAAAGDL